jgi:hypothetical protein
MAAKGTSHSLILATRRENRASVNDLSTGAVGLLLVSGLIALKTRFGAVAAQAIR